VQGPGARCWLKGTATQAFADACCISGTTNNPGIVATGGGGGGGGGNNAQCSLSEPNNPLTIKILPDKNVIVAWTNIPGMTNGDQVFVVPPGYPEGQFHENWAYTNSYSGPFEQKMRYPLRPGVYEARIVKGTNTYARKTFCIT